MASVHIANDGLTAITDYRHALTEGQISHSQEPAIVPRKFWIYVSHGTSPSYENA
jgi:hypothetical protein